MHIKDIYFQNSKKGGWVVLAELQEYDGTNSDVLGTLQINEYILIYFIKKKDHPEQNNIHLIYQEG